MTAAPAAQKAVERQLYETVRLWLLMLALHVPVYLAWGWVLFRHWADFWDAIGSWIDLEYSWRDDEFWYGVYAAAKLALWFLAPPCLIVLEMWLLGW